MKNVFRFLYFHIVFRAWMKNAKGISSFGVMIITQVVRAATKTAHKLRADTAKRRGELKKLNEEHARLAELPVLENDKYFSEKMKYNLFGTFVVVIVLAESCLNYVTTLVMMPDPGLVWIFFRFLTALVVTIAATGVAKALFDAIAPKGKIEEISKRERDVKLYTTAFLTLFIELAIVGFAMLRAEDLEGGQMGFISIGYISLAFALPLLAGYLYWEVAHYRNPLRNRYKLQSLATQRGLLEAAISSNEFKEQVVLKEKINHGWALINEFRTYKENYNERKAVSREDFRGTPIETKAHFTKAITAEYHNQLKMSAEEAKEIAEADISPIPQAEVVDMKRAQAYRSVNRKNGHKGFGRTRNNS